MKIEQSHNRRRWFFNMPLVAPIAITGCIGRPSMQLWQTNSTEVNRRQQSSEAFLDDASKLNQLLNEGVELFQNRSTESTDILHEYFVPRDRVAIFVERMRQVIFDHDADLLNVTVRDVQEDRDTFLRYADQPMLAFVMLFNQPKTESGESRMQTTTRHLIDAALAVDGRYYLPYRLHATARQFHQAYPQAMKFFELKLKYDPDELFQSSFYCKYSGR